jgi:hypothetical protein
METRGYCKLKAEALEGALWRTHFGRGYGPVVRQTTRYRGDTIHYVVCLTTGP